jgi:hypothetical protein
MHHSWRSSECRGRECTASDEWTLYAEVRRGRRGDMLHAEDIHTAVERQQYDSESATAAAALHTAFE